MLQATLRWIACVVAWVVYVKEQEHEHLSGKICLRSENDSVIELTAAPY